MLEVKDRKNLGLGGTYTGLVLGVWYSMSITDLSTFCSLLIHY